MRFKRRKSGSGKGVLFFISLLLIGSGLLRLGDGTGRAMAREVENLMTAVESLPGTPIADNLQVTSLLTRLLEREQEVELRENALKDREAALTIIQDEITANLQELEEAEANLRSTLAIADTAAESDIAKLTKVYESMKSKDAAALFEGMDPSFAAGFLSRMRPETAGAILSGLTPGTAYTISLTLSGRNLNAPKN
jgi:flagellar motility protein MotE (MotC chaperone)